VTEGGRLVVAATPIGNLGDVTQRVLDALRDADVIEAEDTRVTRKLLARFDIHVPLEAYHAKNLERRTPEVLAQVRAGRTVVLVSDAGTPGISDPGAHLVAEALDAGIEVTVLPGPSAIVTALVASGLPTHAFYFGGFLPRKVGDRRKVLEALAALDATLVFYESPRRTAATLSSIAEVMPGRTAAMARELTKIHEEVARGEVGELARGLAERDLKGEVVLLVGPPTRAGGEEAPTAIQSATAADTLDAAARAAIALAASERIGMKQAARRVAGERTLRAKDVYDRAVTLRAGSGSGKAGETAGPGVL
jgi:16S rRNA (cytidine1402-2'-O)-methyltransferase